jgi:energy-coupling factor transporter ATP-binding protein EcfA2
MADFTFSFTHHEDFDNLLTDFGVDVDGLQSDSDTVPDDTVEDEQVYTQSRRSSWEPEDEAIHSVPELSHTEPLHTESSHTEPSHPTLHPAAEEFHSRFWYKDYSTNRSSSLTARTCLDLSRSAQSADEYFLGKEVDPSRELAPPYLQSPTGDNYQGCDDCETKGPNRSYCNVCSLSFCESCWNRNPCHRITHPGIPHEKTPRSLAQKTDAVFDPDIKDGPEREELHCKDVLTSWFGINREDCARPLLQDYGRFEYLMASMGRTSENSFSHLDTSARYPSFVSFVGQTGAGKSSLIKLIIDLGAKTNEQFDTPVVSAKGNTYPTSSDVHLYMDPPTSKSDHPILYADCEGLEGGEREPVAELVKKRATQADSGASDRYDQPISERDIIWADEPWRRSRAFAVKELYPRLLYTFSDVIVFVLKNSKQVSSL